MIDLKKAEEEFMKYVSYYDIKNPRINLKVCHTKRVLQVAINVAKSLNLQEEQVRLAGLIGLLHDIGRFEQLKVYDTFNDRISVDHAEYGIKILFEDNFIRKFVQEPTYDNIIRKAILNHNKFKIEDGLSQEELLYAKIVRDADKIDIVHLTNLESFMTLFKKEDISDEILTDKVYKSIINKVQPRYEDVQTNIDSWINHIGFIYDIYFPYSLKAIHNDTFKCLNRIEYKDIQTKERVKNIEGIINSYFEENENKSFIS